MISNMNKPLYILSFTVLAFVFSNPASSCSPVDHAKLIDYIVQQSRYYWFATALIGAFIVYLSRKRHKGKFIPLLIIFGVVFHPSWTVTPMYSFSCTGQSVSFSRLLAGIFVLFLIFEIFKSKRNGQKIPK